jgi:tetratricopeptide (TPR) repeat protein
VVEGSVLRVGDQVRITAQLIHGDSDTHLWAGSYDRRLDNILALQRDVTQAIVEEIRGRLTPRQETRLVGLRRVDPEAHLAYLKGRHFQRQWTAEGFTKSIEEYERAIAIDPGYAPALAALALMFSWWGFSETKGLPPREVAQRARDAASRALDLDEDSAEAHAALAMLNFSWEWDWQEADRRFERSIQSNPNRSETQHLYSHYLVAMGRFEESYAVSQRVLQLDPLDVEMNVYLGWHHQMAREYEQCLEEAKKAVAVDPAFHEAYWILGLAHLGLGHLPEALSALQKASETSGRIPFIVAALGHAYGLEGQRPEAESILAELKGPHQKRFVSEFNLALVHTGLGDLDHAFGALERGFGARDPRMAYLATEPRFDPLRSDPRYLGLVGRMGLPLKGGVPS